MLTQFIMHGLASRGGGWVWQTCNCTLSGLPERRHDVGLYEPRSIVRNIVSVCKVTMKQVGLTLIAQKRLCWSLLVHAVKIHTVVISRKGAEGSLSSM